VQSRVRRGVPYKGEILLDDMGRRGGGLRSLYIQGDSNMNGTDLCVIKFNQSRSYLNHLVHQTDNNKARNVVEFVTFKNNYLGLCVRFY
jgi:hypothetical protein